MFFFLLWLTSSKKKKDGKPTPSCLYDVGSVAKKNLFLKESSGTSAADDVNVSDDVRELLISDRDI